MDPTPLQSIVVLMADQLGAHALEADHVDAPWLASVKERSRVYEQAYCSFPLCTPSRSSMLTGAMPHMLGVMGNDQHDQFVGRDPRSLGHWFRAHGYRTAWAGKFHAPAPSCQAEDGFEVIHPFGDEGLGESVAAWLEEARTQDQPFLLVASWDDPHTICEYARDQHQPYGDMAPAATRDCPALPANFYTPVPEALQVHRRSQSQVYGTCQYRPEDWRAYRDVYAKLISRLDQQWAGLAQILQESGATVVITSDHGDGDAAHGWNQKTALMQESIRVPLLVAGPEIEPEVITRPVNASTGLLGSLCALAGIPSPPDLPHWDQDKPVVVQTRFQCGNGWAQGRAVIFGQYKYVIYSWGRDREQLFDVIADPQELRNLADESAFDDVREQGRQLIFDWCRDHEDAWMLRKLKWPTSAANAHAEIFDPPY